MFNNSIAVADKIKRDLLKSVVVGDLVLQTIFLGLYAFSIYRNLYNLPFLLTNSILLGISFFYYIFTIISLCKKEKPLSKKIKTTVKNTVNIIKYVIRFVALGLAIYQLFVITSTDLDKLLVIVTGIGLIIQIALEVLTNIISGYIEMFKQSVVMDYEQSKVKWAVDVVTKANEVKNDKVGYVLDAVDFIPGKIAEALTGKKDDPVPVEEKEYSASELKLRNKIAGITKEYNTAAKELKEEKKEEQEAYYEQKREAHRERKFNDLKNHLNTIKDKVINKK